ncbi:hypothetical protein [Streptomyces sp. 1222.5]|uniref:hypothetical protein n=1 Tax=Streptomyces sp. 1222.5 TaxID=1881026 RepID=UPI003D732D5A
MTSLTLFEPDLDADPATPSSGGPAPAEVASAEALASFRATKHKSLNFGLGVDSTALALAIINDPTAFGIAEDFSDFSIVTAMTGFEFPDTIADVENHFLPLLREKGIRYTQVARAGAQEAPGSADADPGGADAPPTARACAGSWPPASGRRHPGRLRPGCGTPLRSRPQPPGSAGASNSKEA